MTASASALVTGAGSGIGRAVAEQLAAEGRAVTLADINSDAVAEAVDSLSAQGLTVRGDVVDVRDFSAVQAVFESATAAYGTPSIVVSAAGVFDGYAGLENTTPELWTKILDINLTGAFHVTRTAILGMLENEVNPGRVIAISSIGGERASADGLAYVASKAGLNQMVRRMAYEVAKRGITVNAVCPGAISTNIHENSPRLLGDSFVMDPSVEAMTQEVLDFLLPMNRLGMPQEVADLVSFLASENSAYVTGQAIAIDGGWTAG